MPKKFIRQNPDGSTVERSEKEIIEMLQCWYPSTWSSLLSEMYSGEKIVTGSRQDRMYVHWYDKRETSASVHAGKCEKCFDNGTLLSVSGGPALCIDRCAKGVYK